MRTEDQVREDLALCHRAFAHLGWTDLIHTHLSARSVAAPDTLWISPYGLLFDEVTPDDLVCVTQDLQIVDDPRGHGVHPAASFHGEVHRHRADVGCVLHSHTVAGQAVAALPEGLRMVSQHALRFHRRLGVHPYGGVLLDGSDTTALLEHLGHHHAMILQHHGLLCTGGSVPDAFDRLWSLQRACEVQIAAGPGAVAVPDALCEHAASQLERPSRDAAARSWQALRRTLAS